MVISLLVLAIILAVLSYVSPQVEKAVRVSAYAFLLVYLVKALV
jgi:hypothetical protein